MIKAIRVEFIFTWFFAGLNRMEAAKKFESKKWVETKYIEWARNFSNEKINWKNLVRERVIYKILV